MAENPGVHRVPFKNETTETVTFVFESRSGPQTAFTLFPNGPSHFEEVQTPLTNQQLRLVVGATSTGRHTNLLVSTDELAGLDEVVVTWEDINAGNCYNSSNNSGNNFGNKVFVLKKTPRNANAGRLSRLWQQLRSWFRNEGASRDSLSV